MIYIQNISHNWGDPREPEYINGYRVASVTYQNGDTFFSFPIIPKRPTGSKSLAWTVVVPAGIRHIANGSIDKCMDICNDVIEYLSQENIKKEFTPNGIESISFTLDTKNIPRGINWTLSKIAAIKDRNTRIFMLLPEAYAASFLLFGFFLVFLDLVIAKSSSYSSFFRIAISAAAYLALIRLLIEIVNDYKTSEFAMSIASFKNKNLNVRRAAISIMVNAWGIRYAVTATLAGLLIYICSSYA